MANIKPISDLRNYNVVLKDCVVDSPVFLTKNGRGKFVILDLEDYNQIMDEIKLLNKLSSSEKRIDDGEKYLSLRELQDKMGV